MMQPLIENISSPVLALDLGQDAAHAILHMPGALPEEEYCFSLPSPERMLSDRIRANTAARRPLFLSGRNSGGAVLSALLAHLRQKLPLYMHPQYAEELAESPAALEGLGVRLAKTAPPDAFSLHAWDYDPAYWQRLLELNSLPQAGSIVVSTTESGSLLGGGTPSTRAGLLQRYFDQAGEQGLSLASLLRRNSCPAMLRLRAIQRSTGLPALDRAFAFVFGMLFLPLIAGRSRREGVVLAFFDKGILRVALLFQQRLYALLELPVATPLPEPGAGLDALLLRQLLEDLRLGWLPSEKVSVYGGIVCRASRLPPEAEGFRPMFMAGADAPLLQQEGQIAASGASSAMLHCRGLLYACGLLEPQ